MNTSDIIVSIAQLAAGGTIVQALVALLRRRSELRQLDRQTESVAVDTADQLVTMLRTELNHAKDEIIGLRRERTDLQRQVLGLGEQISSLRVELAIVRAGAGRGRGHATPDP